MRRAAAISVSVALFWCSAAHADVRYRVTDLGNLGIRHAQAFGVNESGHVVGISTLPTDQLKAFYWSQSAGMIDIIPPGESGTWPTGWGSGINDAAQVVGYIRTNPDQPIRAFVWSASLGFQQLGTLGGPDSKANAVNNVGQVVGYTGVPSGAAHAFIWSAATGMQDIHTLGGDSEANATNERGEVVGYTVINGYGHAFRWKDDTGMVNLGTLGGVSSEAHDINEDGHVVGESASADNGGNTYTRGFLYDETGMHDLGHLGSNRSRALAINDYGEIVGWSNLAGEVTARAFYHDGTTMTDLNTLIDPASGWFIYSAQDINNAGQIVGVAQHVNEPWGHGVLLTPVPEPAIALVGTLGTFLPVLSVRRARQRPQRK
jgi:probable HAF family extracellular repeat protein